MARDSFLRSMLFASVLLLGMACETSQENNGTPNDGTSNTDAVKDDVDDVGGEAGNDAVGDGGEAGFGTGDGVGDTADADAPEDRAPVGLGAGGDYTILGKSGISSTGETSIVGDIGLSPASASNITGLNLSSPPTTHTNSPSVTGVVYAADYDEPTPTELTTGVGAMETAYTDAAGRTSPDFTELGGGNIDGLTLEPGLYKWGTGVTIPSGVTLSGDSNDVWIFQIGENLEVGNGASVTLEGGARAENVFWQVAGETTLGTTSDFRGIVLSKTLVAMKTGASIVGRLYAQTAVTLDAATVTEP